MVETWAAGLPGVLYKSFLAAVTHLLQVEQEHKGANCDHQLTQYAQHFHSVRQTARNDRIGKSCTRSRTRNFQFAQEKGN